MRKTDNRVQWCADLMTHIGEESRFQIVGHLRFVLRRLEFPLDHLQLRDIPLNADDDRRGQLVTIHLNLPFVKNNQIPVPVLSLSDPMQSFSGSSYLNILLPLLFRYNRRIEVIVILAHRIIIEMIAVVRFAVPIHISEIIVNLFHHNPCGKVIDRRIHNPVEPFDLRLIPHSFRDVMSERPETLLAGITDNVVHRTFVSQNILMNFRGMMRDKRIAAVLHRIPAPFLPSLFGRHICNDIIDFQSADVRIIHQTVIVQKTSVGKDHRTVGFGGIDTLFRIINGMSQCIDIIPPVLENSDILDIPFYIAASVGQFLPQISLDTHIENIPVQPDPVTDTFLIEFRHILFAPILESRVILLHY